MWTFSSFLPKSLKGPTRNIEGPISKDPCQSVIAFGSVLSSRSLLAAASGSAYKNREIPPELDINELFEKYYETLKRVGPLERDLQPLIGELVDEMFVGDTGTGAISEPPSHAIPSFKIADESCSTTLTSPIVTRVDLSFERKMSFESGRCGRIRGRPKRGSGLPTIVSSNICWPSDSAAYPGTSKKRDAPVGGSKIHFPSEPAGCPT